MKSCAQYIAEAKAALGNPAMSDRELGERLGGYLQQNIARAKSGTMPDTIAIALAKAIGIHPGMVLEVARAEREKNQETRAILLDWAKKASALMPEIAAEKPDVVIRGGVKAVRYSPDQGWRKRSVSPPRAVGGSFLEARPPRAFFIARPRA